MANSKITMKDVYQSVLGSFSSVLIFFAIRQDPINIDPTMGLIITILYVAFMYYGFNGQRSSALARQFALTFVVTATVSAALSVVFKLVDPSLLLTMGVFGSAVAVGVWIGLPVALLFNLKDLNNILSRYQFMAQKK